jgi:iron complex transport system permease protein
MNWIRQHHVFVLILTFFLVLIGVFTVSIVTGFISLTPRQLLRTLTGQGTQQEELILYTFRLPRILITILAGMGLAVSGAILQSISKNALADPGILGINSGAGLMIVFYVMFVSAEVTSALYTLPLFAFLGALLTALAIYFLAMKKGEGINPTRMVLAGVGMAAALTGAILTLGSSLEREEYDFFANWIAGRIWGDDWVFVLALLPWIVILFSIVYQKANVLNLLNLDEQAATGLGVNLARERMLLLLLAVGLAAAAVSVSGGIAFVGLIAPQIARSLVGNRHQSFLPLAAICGAIFLLAADTIGRVALDPIGIPAGIVFSLVGAPYFMYVMVKR